tara:strand:+ start:3270 stop:3455 length:186 start_codon:yes stop_codon:yes gene_type:complete
MKPFDFNQLNEEITHSNETYTIKITWNVGNNSMERVNAPVDIHKCLAKHKNFRNMEVIYNG